MAGGLTNFAFGNYTYTIGPKKVFPSQFYHNLDISVVILNFDLIMTEVTSKRCQKLFKVSDFG